MRMTKKIFTILAAAVLCGNFSSNQVAAEDLKVWTLTFGNEQVNTAWRDILSGFEAQNPNVKISLETRGIDQHKSALRIAAQSDKGPDVFFMWAGPGLAGEFIGAGLSLPLDDAYEANGWDERLLGTAAGFSNIYDNGRHGVPYTFHGEGIYYNKALFEKAGITAAPTTYDEMKIAAQKLSDAGIPAMTFGGSVNWHVMRLMDVILEAKCGAETHDQLKSMTLDWSTEPCATQSFAELDDWARNYILSPFMGIDHSQSFNLFLANRAAMMLEGDWLVGQLRQSKRMEDFDMFPFPTGTGRLYGFAEYLYVSSKSQQSEAAIDFLDYLLSDEIQQRYLGIFGAISVNANTQYKNVDPLDQRWMDTFAQYQNVYMNGDQAFPLDTTTEYFRVIDAVVSGDLAPESAGQTLQEFINNRS